MSDEQRQAVIKMDGFELGVYRQGSEVVVHLNQGGVCLLPERISLLPELAGESGVSVETLRRLGGAVRIGVSLKNGDV